MSRLEQINFNGEKISKKQDIQNQDFEKISYNLAKISHGLTMKTRKSGDPYFEGHSLKVADIYIKDLYDKKEFDKINSDFSKKVTSSAYLHDVLEDTKLDKKWIDKLVGKDILDIIETLTENKDYRKELEEKLNNNQIDKFNLKMLMLEDSIDKIKKIKESSEENYKIAAIVRISDIFQNLEDFEKQSDDLKKRNLEKAKKIIESFSDVELSNKLKERVCFLDKEN